MKADKSEKEYIEEFTGKFKADRYEPNDREMLALLLSYVGAVKSPVQTADNLIDHFGSYRECFFADLDELCGIDGMCESAAVLLKATANVCSIKDSDSFIGRHISELGKMLEGITQYRRGEVLYIIALDSNDVVIGTEKRVSDDPDSISLAISDAVDLAARVMSRKIMIVHTHPTQASAELSISDTSAVDVFGEILEKRGIEFVGISVLAGGKQKLYRYKKK